MSRIHKKTVLVHHTHIHTYKHTHKDATTSLQDWYTATYYTLFNTALTRCFSAYDIHVYGHIQQSDRNKNKRNTLTYCPRLVLTMRCCNLHTTHISVVHCLTKTSLLAVWPLGSFKLFVYGSKKIVLEMNVNCFVLFNYKSIPPAYWKVALAEKLDKEPIVQLSVINCLLW